VGWGFVAVGFIKGRKADSIGGQAERAVAEGRTVFTCRVNEGGWNDSWGGSLSGVAEQIEAVEAAGWHLDKASFLPGKGEHVSAFLIFRRANPVQNGRSVAGPGMQRRQYVDPGPGTTTWGQR
jgi:hypothetical protein